MTTKNNSLRFPAEWEYAGPVMLAWPHEDTDWAYILPQVRECFAQMARAIARFTPVLIVGPANAIRNARDTLADIPANRLITAEVPTNDTWVRDYGPLSVQNGSDVALLDFAFNAWGLKFAANLDNQVCRVLDAKGLWQFPLLNNLDFVLEGGSIESDGRGTLLTTAECLFGPNRNPALSRSQILDRLADSFGFSHFLILDHGALQGDDTDSHIDTLARFAPHDTIIYATQPGSSPQARSLTRMAEQLASFRRPDGSPYNLIGLPLPDPIADPDDGHILPATYANFLALPDAIIMPAYGQPRNDRLAADILRIAFPEHEVVPVDCRPLIRQHGSLHCATMQLPFNALPI